ncbi:hypothetical protein [Sphingobium phenoxybenzoativorans]|uniref:hypothetical protein n=1 Tax=Sphingobium phenoxybenzoativorans TaxID=1592790 RepID=UPI0008733ED8|nr:hypothetical protein [Sphingobium phenoxybenzoativorans]
MKKSAIIGLPLFFLAVSCGQPQNPAGNESTTENAAASDADITNIAEDSDSVNAGDNIAAAAAVAGWAGRWTGPEGLFLDIKPSKDGQPGHFALTIKDNLDTQGDYMGTAQDGAIVFERNGKTETIRPGAGAETGFKYLADKTDCLIVQSGKEGYCR